MRELERTGAFDRSWLMVASPTGTGYVNYAATSILEFLTRGDCASVAMQYSARPSPLSLDRVKEGRLHTRMLCQAIAERCAQCPADARPKVLLFGESLGAWTSQDGFVDQGTQGLIDAGHRLRDLDRHPALQQMEGAGSLRRPSRCRPFAWSAASTTSRSGKASSRASANGSASS